MKNVTKEIFLNTLTCPALGWLLRSEEGVEQLSDKVLTLGERFRIEQGLDIHNRARQLYPDGVLVKRKDIETAAQETMDLIDNPEISTIFEGTFLADNYIAKADILRRLDGSWYLTEVKSSVNDKEEFIDDMAYTGLVIKRSCFSVGTISLLLISKDYRLGMDNRALFVEIDHTGDTLDRIEQFESFWGLVNEITKASVQPKAELKLECKSCPLFEDCLGKSIDNHILEIPRLHQTKFERLKELNIVCIEDVPTDFPLSDNQARVRNCVVAGQPYISSQLKNDLDAIIWPAFYLDFETVMTAVPLYHDIGPYTQLPTQYSIHKYANIRDLIEHREYLADPSRDCRREFADNLIKDLENNGSIVVYSNFEKNVIDKLGQLYPDLAKKLNSLIERIIDLEAIIKRNFYHPDFHGSTSIKRTLPALVPEMSYESLEIADGDSASAAFAFMAWGSYREREEIESIERNLLAYCKQDTLAMVKLHEKLCEVCTNQ